MKTVFQDLHKEINLEVDGKQIELPPIEGPFKPFLNPFIPFLYPFIPFLHPFIPFLYPFIPFLYPFKPFLYPFKLFLYPFKPFLYPFKLFLNPFIPFLYASILFLYPFIPFLSFSQSSVCSSCSSVSPNSLFVHPVPGLFHSSVRPILSLRSSCSSFRSYCSWYDPFLPSLSHSFVCPPPPRVHTVSPFVPFFRAPSFVSLLRSPLHSSVRLYCFFPHLGCVIVAFFGWREIWTFAHDDLHFQYESMIVHDSNVIGIDVQMVSSFLTWNTLSWHLWMKLLL